MITAVSIICKMYHFEGEPPEISLKKEKLQDADFEYHKPKPLKNDSVFFKNLDHKNMDYQENMLLWVAQTFHQ